MPDQFERIADYVQRACSLDDAERIRALGVRRLGRRRAGGAVLGTGAVALVGLGAAVAFDAASPGRGGTSAAGSASSEFRAGAGAFVTAGESPLGPNTPVSITDPEDGRFFADYDDPHRVCVGTRIRSAGRNSKCVRPRTCPASRT